MHAGGERVIEAEGEAPGGALGEAGHPHMQRRRLDSAHINILITAKEHSARTVLRREF